MNTTVCLVRHGQTDPNLTEFCMGWSDEDLNETGYAQVHRLSRRLADLPVTKVYTSPLRRAHTTAAILAHPHKLEPWLSDDLTEIQFGHWEGLHEDEIKRRWPGLWKQWRLDPSEVRMPEGESLRDVTERVVRAFRETVEDNRGGQVLIVSHDVVIKALVTHVLGAANSTYWRIKIDNASLNCVHVVDDSYQLIALNDTSHLDPED